MSNLQESNKLIVKRFNKEFIDDKNDSAYEALVSAGFVDHTGGAVTPFDFITKIFRPAFPDAKVVIHDLVAEGDKVVARKSYEGTHSGDFLGVPATRKFIKFMVIEIIQLRDGKYVNHWGVADTAGLMQQLNSA
jgi:predicted ester cyclase